MAQDNDIKPIGWHPDGTHIHKGALAVVIAVLVGLYCIVSDNPFGMSVIETVTK